MSRPGGNRAKRKKMAGVENLRLGCRPIHAGVRIYIERMQGRWRGRTTIPEETRKLYWIAGRFEEMQRDGAIRSTDPRHLTEKDIQLFLLSIKYLDPDSQRRHISRLNTFLKFYKNYVIEDMMRQGYTLPRCAHKKVRVIEGDDMRILFETADGMTGWDGSVCRGMLALYLATGVRPSELRLAEFKDLDLRRERFYVRHPKGEGSWSSPEWVDLIVADMLPRVRRFVDEREEYLFSKGFNNAKYLFPNLYRGKDGGYSANSWRKVKQKLVTESGVDFRIKDFRSTLCSMTVNEDLSRIPAMSVQLRHSSIGTTQQYYTAIQRSNAGKSLRAVWDTGSMVNEKGFIPQKSEVSGHD